MFQIVFCQSIIIYYFNSPIEFQILHKLPICLLYFISTEKLLLLLPEASLHLLFEMCPESRGSRSRLDILSRVNTWDILSCLATNSLCRWQGIIILLFHSRSLFLLQRYNNLTLLVLLQHCSCNPWTHPWQNLFKKF